MNEQNANVPGLRKATYRLARHALAAGENRIELLLVELQEERERLVQSLGLLLSVMALALLAGIGLTLTMVLLFWTRFHVWPLVALTLLYTGIGLALHRLLQRRLREWQILPESLNQLRRDSAALDRFLR